MQNICVCSLKHFSVSLYIIYVPLNFLTESYPVGEELPHPKVPDSRTAKNRTTLEEKRVNETVHSDMYNDARKAAEAHRRVIISNNID